MIHPRTTLTVLTALTATVVSTLTAPAASATTRCGSYDLAVPEGAAHLDVACTSTGVWASGWVDDRTRDGRSFGVWHVGNTKDNHPSRADKVRIYEDSHGDGRRVDFSAVRVDDMRLYQVCVWAGGNLSHSDAKCQS